MAKRGRLFKVGPGSPTEPARSEGMLKRHATFVVAVLVAAIAFTAVGVGRPVTAHAYSACQTYLETKACAINWYGGLDAVTNYDGGAGWSEGSCYYMDLEVYVDGNLWWS